MTKEQKQEEPKEEEKPEEEEKKKADITPQWALELKASIEKLADVLGNRSVDKQEEDEEEKPKEEEKQEEKPKEEEDKKPEEKADADPEPKEEEEKVKSDEEKFKTMVENAVQAALPSLEKAIMKRFSEDPVKRGVAVPAGVPKGESVDTSMEALYKMSWGEVNALAKRLGA